ncbi:unnamed protein product [Ambrosiozyma monospora]|uniref:Unnamed protein product n=1 Tax=Ambrosiozyma monospora TaxID=43982 RepID=A0ACB5TPV6_AMBMO|nr:unnamed protein product [Ambrosiozyma monospora]
MSSASANSTSKMPQLTDEIKEQILKKDVTKGPRVSGKEWKVQKKAFRVKALGVKSSWEKRQLQREKDKQTNAKLKEMKEERERERKEKIQTIKERREKIAEKERYERLATIMKAKKLDRLKRREKRNKMLKER